MLRERNMACTAVPNRRVSLKHLEVAAFLGAFYYFRYSALSVESDMH
jgi:hypothetical protein